ncbi:MAG: alpha/beta hydrolase, partial [Myxococcales bacterium]
MSAPRPLSSLLIDVGLRGLSRAARAHPWARQDGHSRGAVFRDVRYAAGEGDAHLLDIHVPAGPGPFPVVLYLHGGGFRILSKDTHWMMVEHLRRAGYLVYNANYRLAPGHRFPAAAQDAAAALRFVAATAGRYGGDIDRLVLAGESAGANLVTGLAVACSWRRPEPWARGVFDDGIRPRAVLAYCGLLEVRKHERFDGHAIPPWQRERIRLVCREYLDDGDVGAAGSDLADPLSILEQAVEPPERPLPAFFISAGTADPIVDDSERLGRALDRLGVPNEVRIFPGEMHAFQAIFWRLAARESWRGALDLAARHLG